MIDKTVIQIFELFDGKDVDLNDKNGLKGKRFNLLFYSTDTLENLKILKKVEDVESVNALINKILLEYIENHTREIRIYKNIFKENNND